MKYTYMFIYSCLALSVLGLSGCSMDGVKESVDEKANTLIERDQAQQNKDAITGATSTGLSKQLIEARFDASIGALNLNRLNLSELPDLCGVFSGYRAASVLAIDLSSNQLTTVSGDLSCFTQLKSIDLGFNNISSFVTLGNLSGLQELIIHKNKLTSLGGIVNLSGLQHLNIGFNEFKDLVGIDNLSNLTTLEIYHNTIKSLVGVEGLKKLKELHLEFNNLVDTSLLKKLPSLKTISGSGKEQMPTGGVAATGSLSN